MLLDFVSVDLTESLHCCVGVTVDDAPPASWNINGGGVIPQELFPTTETGTFTSLVMDLPVCLLVNSDLSSVDSVEQVVTRTCLVVVTENCFESLLCICFGGEVQDEVWVCFAPAMAGWLKQTDALTDGIPPEDSTDVTWVLVPSIKEEAEPTTFDETAELGSGEQ